MALATPIRIAAITTCVLSQPSNITPRLKSLPSTMFARALVQTGDQDLADHGDQPGRQGGAEQLHEEAGAALRLHGEAVDGLGAVVGAGDRLDDHELHDHDGDQDADPGHDHRDQQGARAGDELAPAVADRLGRAVRRFPGRWAAVRARWAAPRNPRHLRHRRRRRRRGPREAGVAGRSEDGGGGCCEGGGGVGAGWSVDPSGPVGSFGSLMRGNLGVARGACHWSAPRGRNGCRAHMDTGPGPAGSGSGAGTWSAR